jgi:hypothetical protein
VRCSTNARIPSIEPQFYARLLEPLEIPSADAPQWDRDRWPEILSCTPGAAGGRAGGGDAALAAWGVYAARRAELRAAGAF